jgi:hydrophobic/amphiphilic exporter-1 (mainly G- bacteria), HAE1 family
MSLTRIAIRRPLTVLMVILALVVMGVRAYTMMQVDRLPKTDLPYVTVLVVYPGASPEDVNEEVVKPIEDAVASVSGLKNITSSANENVGAVILEFNLGVNGAKAATDVDRAVSAIRGDLPDAIQEPRVVQADLSAVPIVRVVLSGPQGQDVLYALARDELKPALESVNGVGSVSVSGGREREIHVDADPARLAAYGLPIEALQQALGLANVSAPAGSVEQGTQVNAVRSLGRFNSLADIEDTIIIGGPSPIQLPASLLPKAPQGMDTVGLVTVKDVATVREDYAEAGRLVRYNGRDGVLLKIVKTGDANAIQVADAVRAQVETFKAKLPAGASADIVLDDSKFTRQAVAGVQEDLILAVLITGLIMLLFLHTIRSTLIVLLAIPTSIIATFLVMWALGFSLNTLTLMALTLVIGILVDDSIVVLENIERHLKMKKMPAQAALDGRSEIGLAAIAITLVDVVVYVPVAFTSGIVGQIFRSYGLTIAAATLFSLLVSFTLTPMLAAKWLRSEGEEQPRAIGVRRFLGALLSPFSWLWKQFTRGWDAAFGGLAHAYGRTLRWVLKNPLTQLVPVVIAVAALAAGIWMVRSGVVPTELLPYQDDGQISITVQMPAGSNLTATDHAVQRVEEVLRANVPETAAVLTTLGATGSDFLGTVSKSNSATILLLLVDKNDRARSTGSVIAALRPRLAEIPDLNAALSINALISALPAGAYVQVYGPDQNTLINVADQVEAVVRRVPGVKDIQSNASERAPETQIVVDRARAKDLGLTPGQIAYTLRTALSGTTIGSYRPAGAEKGADIVLRADDRTRGDLSRLLEMPLGYVSGKQIRLNQVATLVETQAAGSIGRSNRLNTLTIEAGGSGRGDADMANAIEAAVKSQMSFPAGYGFRLAGATEVQRDAFSQMTMALALSIVLIYMLLVALYQSWLQPLAIMFALPVTLVGAFGGLLLTGNTLNMFALLGVIMLAGIVTKNAILIVDFTNVLRRDQGYARKDALATAGRLRLRPILMTTAAIVGSLLPVLFGRGAGAEIRAPLAAVVIGGNISSTLLTLVLVPVIYNILDTISGLFKRAARRPEEAPQSAVAAAVAAVAPSQASDAGVDAA